MNLNTIYVIATNHRYVYVINTIPIGSYVPSDRE